MCVFVCVCVCVCGWVCIEREKERERERELYLFPDLPTPKYICQYSKLSVSVFSDLWSDYLVCFVLLCVLQMHHQSIKTKTCQRTFFYHISFKNSVWTHIFNKTDALQNGTLWHSDTSILFMSAKVVLDKRHSEAFILFTSAKFRLLVLKSFWIKDHGKISSKAMHHVCCFRWCRHVISWTVDVWSELVSLVSCILPQFRAVTCYRPLCLQTRHMWRWLTSAKLRMQSQCSLV